MTLKVDEKITLVASLEMELRILEHGWLWVPSTDTFKHSPAKRSVTFNSGLTKLISPKCRIYASVNRVNIGSDNGLSPIRRQAII